MYYSFKFASHLIARQINKICLRFPLLAQILCLCHRLKTVMAIFQESRLISKKLLYLLKQFEHSWLVLMRKHVADLFRHKIMHLTIIKFFSKLRKLSIFMVSF